MNRNPDIILRELLRKRGITGEADIEEFLSERPSVAHDPFLLHNMKAGVDLILEEIDKGTSICIYGDYDADGVTSVCIMMLFLGHLTDNIFYYIPSRFTDGYGLNKSALEKIKGDGAGLVITVDCGSVSYSEVEFAKSIGLKVIVTDHHSVDEVKADCILINPKQKECNYPFKGLAGCGVAFKLCQAIRIRNDMPRDYLNSCLDLVAIGTVADIVPLLDENRTIVKYGLMKINQRSRMSVGTLLDGISLKNVKSENISFGIAPHINAAGRMGSASDAVELFLAEDPVEAGKQTDILKERNYMRKGLQDRAYKECMESIGDEEFIVLYRENIHEGIGGIVAGKIKEELNRPCIILTPTKDGRIKGTGRSIESIDLHDFLKEFARAFDTFGGHKGACGFTMSRDKLGELRKMIDCKMKRLLSDNESLLDVSYKWDMELKTDEITIDLYRAISRMEPFGAGNMRPVFSVKNVELRDLKWLGDKRQHLKFKAHDSCSYGENGIDCIIFGHGQKYAELENLNGSRGKQVERIIGTIEINTWNGRTTVQFRVEDILI